MKKKETNMLLGGALILGAYWFWKKKQDAEMGSYGAGGAYDWIGRGNAYDWIGRGNADDWIRSIR